MIDFDGKQMRRDIAAQSAHDRACRDPPRVTQTDVEAEFEDLDVDAPRVGIVMGSKSDMPAMEAAAKELEQRGILHEVRVMSAHRDPEMVADYAKNAQMRGLRVIIAGAGLSAALPGVVAAHIAAAGHRRAADVRALDRRRARRPALDRPDAARRARRVRGRGLRAQRRGAGRADPGDRRARGGAASASRRLWSMRCSPRYALGVEP